MEKTADAQEFFYLGPIDVEGEPDPGIAAGGAVPKSKPKLERNASLLDPDDILDFDYSKLSQRRPSKLAEALLDDLPQFQFNFEHSTKDGEPAVDPFALYRATSEERLAVKVTRKMTKVKRNTALDRLTKFSSRIFRSGSESGPGTPKTSKKLLGGSVSVANLTTMDTPMGSKKNHSSGAESPSILSPKVFRKKLSIKSAFSWDNPAILGAYGGASAGSLALGPPGVKQSVAYSGGTSKALNRKSLIRQNSKSQVEPTSAGALGAGSKESSKDKGKRDRKSILIDASSRPRSQSSLDDMRYETSCI
jgi:hypothetical protein